MKNDDIVRSRASATVAFDEWCRLHDTTADEMAAEQEWQEREERERLRREERAS